MTVTGLVILAGVLLVVGAVVGGLLPRLFEYWITRPEPDFSALDNTTPAPRIRVNGLVTDPPRPGEGKLRIVTRADGTARVFVVYEAGEVELLHVEALRHRGDRLVVEVTAAAVDLQGPAGFDLDIRAEQIALVTQ